ncbi:hypothetical protein JQS43_24370 [Natronosporangium hydrolyticum]|uniref:DUF2997 domain-containing protein n=1 Tax=Natronosporangium hydrolyticum TaxID=2811111 RepID=A0A895YKE1_9ACTN|nr:hypothetical protein [Natronosporangium hydrolyticum]QSB14570.1 hypothetical protein JQS43_24370 [Natronosporangium hydrolyticum]
MRTATRGPVTVTLSPDGEVTISVSLRDGHDCVATDAGTARNLRDALTAVLGGGDAHVSQGIDVVKPGSTVIGYRADRI